MGNYLGGGGAQGTSFRKSELLLKQDGALFEIWKGVEVDVSGQEKPVTIFYFDGAQATQEKVALVKNAINRTKLIRIPETITFKNAEEINGALVIATEYVEPLSKRLSELSIDEKIAGLHNIVKALDFIHTKANPIIEHKNLSINSIFVNPSDSTDWKLGGFELAAPATENVGASDIKQLAALIEHLGITKAQSNLYDLPAFLAAANSSSPQSCGAFLKSNFFKENSFVGIISYLRDMVNKSNEENTQFFRTLQSKLTAVPRERLVSNILPRLKKFHVLVEPSAQEFLPAFFSIIGQEADDSVTGLWTAEEFRKNIAEFVAWTFSQTSPELKIVMLRNIRHCLHTFTAKSLADILTELANSLSTSRHNEFVDEAAGAISAILKHIAANNVVIEPRETIRQTQVAMIMCAKDTTDDDVKANLLLRISELLDSSWPEDKLADLFFACSLPGKSDRVRQAGAAFAVNLVRSARGEAVSKLYPNVVRTLGYMMVDKDKSVRETAYHSLVQSANYVMELLGHSVQLHTSHASDLSLKKVTPPTRSSRSSVASSPRTSASFDKPVVPNNTNTRPAPTQPTIVKEAPKASSAGWGDFGGFDDEEFDSKKDNNETTLPDHSFDTQQSLVTSTPTKVNPSYDDVLAPSNPPKQEKKEPVVEEEDDFSMFGLAPKIKAAPTLVVEKSISPPAVKKPVSKVIEEEPVLTTSTRLHGSIVADEADLGLGESAWGVDDSMLDIDLPNANVTPVETPVDTTSATPVETTSNVVSEPTPVEIATPEPTVTPTSTDPTPVEQTPVESAPKEPEVVEQQTSSPEPTNEPSPPTSEEVTQVAETKKKESRPAKGRKPDAGSAKKKSAKKPEVAKVQNLSFDSDDE